jgi:hypothetical protein
MQPLLHPGTLLLRALLLGARLQGPVPLRELAALARGAHGCCR